MKQPEQSLGTIAEPVAPHAGAWIETNVSKSLWKRLPVAPHAGAWIETSCAVNNANYLQVAPHAGAWIETLSNHEPIVRDVSRPPRGGVD